MKGDFSKNTFDAKKHFHDVLMQQGRVLLDSDWNEQGGITVYRVETGTNDIVGVSGAPMHAPGFEIIPGNSLSSPPVQNGELIISKGRFYVEGILCENEEDVLFVNQPDFNSSPLPTDAGAYTFYLDVWLRHITAVENPDIREVALGGPDTTSRTQTIWQVKYIKSGAGENCLTVLPDNIIGLPYGKLKAISEKVTGSADPCGLTASGGYRRLENQLYRVEIHIAGNRSKATFKWSRDNGSVIVKWESQDQVNPNKLTVSSTGRDELLGFKAGDWIELIDNRTDLLNIPGVLAELSKVDGNVLTIKASSIKDPENPSATTVTISKRENQRIRRWDSAGDLKMNTNASTWISLEEGVQVLFSPGTYQTGDYWMIPARTAKADIEWSYTDPQLPQGIKHHFAKLAILNLDQSTGWSVLSDCRPVFPPLTELVSLFYLSGDGQEARPDQQLANKLLVGVANGKSPVKNAKIKFEIRNGGGSVTPSNNSLTNTSGIAECTWKLGTTGIQQVQATLLDAAGAAVHLPVIFNAKLTPPAMFYVSGDGQEAMPSSQLLSPLKAGVAYEQFPVTGATIKFEVISGGGKFDDGSGSQTVNTGADGIATSRNWILGTAGIQQVKATLSDPQNINNTLHLPIIFTADLSKASNIKYDGGECNNWGDQPHNTVAEAITALCRRENNKGCMVTVGIEGQFKNLKEAFERFKKEKAKDICICLLPQTESHNIETSDVTVEGTIKIVGCGSFINMKVRSFIMSASTIILHGFHLRDESRDDGLIIMKAAKVITEHCSFEYNKYERDLPFIIVSPFNENDKEISVIKWNNNMISAKIALALTSGVGGWIENNRINGDVYLLYVRKVLPLQWDTLTAETRKQIEGDLEKVTFNTRGIQLHINANHFNGIYTNPGRKLDIIKNLFEAEISGYQNLFVSENIVNSGQNSLISDTLSLINNHFVGNEDQTTVYSLGHTGVIMGNTLPGKAGGIDSLFDTGRKIKAPNIGKVV